MCLPELSRGEILVSIHALSGDNLCYKLSQIDPKARIEESYGR